MPHPWYHPILLCLLAASLVILTTYLYLYATHRRRYILVWSGCWAALAGLYLCLLADDPTHPTPLLFVAAQGFSMTAALLMLQGSLEFSGRRLPTAAWIVAALLLSWVAYATGDYDFSITSLPVFLYASLAYILAGMRLIGSGQEHGPGNKVAGWILVLMGLHQLDHPFMHLAAWLPLAGLLTDTIFLAGASLAIVMAHFERARFELSRSEARFRLLAENSPDIIWTTDADLRLAYASPAALNVLGYTPEELLTLDVKDLMPPESLARRNAAVEHRRRLEAAGEIEALNRPLRVELEYRHKDGRSVWVETITSQLSDSEGRLTGVIGLTRDMTQRKKMALQQARRARADAAMLELSNMLVRRAESIRTLAAHVLDAAREHTDCPHGFVSEVDPATGDNVAHTLATEMQDADIPEGADRRIAFPVQEDGTYRGLFGHALNTGQAFYTNDPASHPASVGTPEWHIDITNFLTAPAVVDDQVLGQIALANSPRPFTDDDLSTVTRMANFYALAVQRKRTEDNIRASLAEKKTLLQEIHHRVKNNLQIISGLLYLQADLVSDPTSLELFQESQQRIASMALVHEELYRSQDLSLVDMADYCTLLSERLLRTLAPGRDIVCRVEVQAFNLAVDKAVPCGLLLNELLTNAVKHAFPDDRPGIITIGGGRTDDRVWLSVADNGVGLPPNMDPATMPSLGMQLVTNLSQQLHGVLDIKGDGGAFFRLEFEP